MIMNNSELLSLRMNDEISLSNETPIVHSRAVIMHLIQDLRLIGFYLTGVYPFFFFCNWMGDHPGFWPREVRFPAQPNPFTLYF